MPEPPQSQTTPQQKPWYKSCGAQATGSALEHGAIDALGVAVPEAGFVVGALTTDYSNGTGAGVTAGSSAVMAGQLAYPEVKALPIVGNVLSAFGFVYDGYSAFKQYQTCKAGGG